MVSDWSPAEFTERKMSLVMHLAGFIPSAYFSIHHLVDGIFWYGLSILPCALAILVSLFLLFTKPNSQGYKVADAWFLLLAIPPVLLALTQDSMHGEFFVPALILACFIHLPLKVAERLVLLVSLVAIILGTLHLGIHQGIRFSLGVVASHIFAWGLARVLVKQNNELKELAFKDSLTRCYNRRALFDELQKAKQQHKRSSIKATLILLDLDHFKLINDQHGHHAGDQILVWFSHFLQNNTRGNDRVFRYGGEEFLILLHDADFDMAYQASEKLVEAISQREAPLQLSISFSAGISCIKDDESIDDWIQRADLGLYQAKQAGRRQTWPVQFTSLET
ncbi:GGDEF domain-containing protein [Agarivorans sp. TSD2052]|uniref:GGDEF domain-containing protein n=1 Tax=Agarivorans sp. TSD2052 TaxID=2937286 RepID=UPI00200F495D|nr:GGDEF domain-containing protein [Agarivorans sp. TSD2052]UPW17846.1 GGDEF domain-containing protein [Agarivorans sp. TSD2052]